MKALFIGGTGIISTAIVRRLINELHWEVWLLNRGNRLDAVPAEAHSIIADIHDEADVAQKLEGMTFDVVSDSGGRFAQKVMPALRYTDNAIMNEIECCGAAQIAPRDADGRLIPANIRTAMEKMLEAGVTERVIVHCP